MVRTQLMLTEDHYHFLRELSKEKGRSMSDLVREAIDLMSQRHELPGKALLSVIGAFTDDRGDVSENHDRYLAEVKETDEDLR